jgi:hypothetical protein
VDRADAVLLFVGTLDAEAKAYAERDAAKVASALADVVRKLKVHPATAKARVVVSTPFPVIDARLDQWSKERFAGGERASDAIADAFRKVAADTGSALIDFHAWAKADADGGKAGRLAGSIGWQMRDWGHPIAARYFADQFVALDVAPPDAAAFAEWTAERAARAKLTEILSATSEGVIAHDGAFPATLKSGNPSTWEIPLPPERVSGDELNLLFTSGDKPLAAIGNASNRPAVSTVLTVNADGKDIAIPLRGGDWQVVDEAKPDTAVDPNRYRFSMQKMNYFGLTGSGPGERRWVLARFDLSPAAGKKITAAKLSIGVTPGVEKFTPPDRVEKVNGDALGNPVAHFVTGPDAAWDETAATWKTRDGKVGWTGGRVDAAKRKAAIESFLQTAPPEKVAAEARQYLPQ